MEGRIEYGNGTVFSLTPPANPGGTWTETVLYVFGKHEVPGSYSPFIPIGGVLPGPDGTLFGVTHYNYYDFPGSSQGGAMFNSFRPPRRAEAGPNALCSAFSRRQVLASTRWGA